MGILNIDEQFEPLAGAKAEEELTKLGFNIIALLDYKCLQKQIPVRVDLDCWVKHDHTTKVIDKRTESFTVGFVCNFYYTNQSSEFIIHMMPIGEFNWYRDGEQLSVDEYTFKEIKLINPSLTEIRAAICPECLRSRIVKTNLIK
jgi:hypothetical protein